MAQMTNTRVVLITGPRVANGTAPKSSLARLADSIRELLSNPGSLAAVTEVVISGGWIFSHHPMDVLEAKFGKMDLESAVDTDVTDEPVRTGDLTRARSQSSAAQKDVLKKHELEWSLALNFVKSLLEKIDKLHALKWETDLPFSKDIWSVVPGDIEELSVNLFVPDGDTRGAFDPHPDYFTHDDLKHLINFRKLKSLRVYCMVDSFQPILWETVWRNPGLHTLELGMLYNPITRNGEGKPMPLIDANWNYNTERTAAETYRGQDGSGMLHHAHGHGEYMDHIAIGKARALVLPGVKGNLDALPIKTLRLANFVVDDLAFAKFFDNLERLVFCDRSVDAGLVLPKRLNNKIRIFARPQGLGAVPDSTDVEVEVKKVSQADA